MQIQSRFDASKVDVTEVTQRLRLTFADRREDVLRPLGVQELREKYPLLFSRDQVNFIMFVFLVKVVNYGLHQPMWYVMYCFVVSYLLYNVDFRYSTSSNAWQGMKVLIIFFPTWTSMHFPLVNYKSPKAKQWGKRKIFSCSNARRVWST